MSSSVRVEEFCVWKKSPQTIAKRALPSGNSTGDSYGRHECQIRNPNLEILNKHEIQNCRLSLEHFDDSNLFRISVFGFRISRSDLNHAGVEVCFWHGSGDALQQADQDIAGFVRLNDGIDPAAGCAVTN